ncbi:MAG: hypothetical protein ACRC00_13045 [Exiguobacterium acetylicum]
MLPLSSSGICRLKAVVPMKAEPVTVSRTGVAPRHAQSRPQDQRLGGGIFLLAESQ